MITDCKAYYSEQVCKPRLEPVSNYRYYKRALCQQIVIGLHSYLNFLKQVTSVYFVNWLRAELKPALCDYEQNKHCMCKPGVWATKIIVVSPLHDWKWILRLLRHKCQKLKCTLIWSSTLLCNKIKIHDFQAYISHSLFSPSKWHYC